MKYRPEIDGLRAVAVWGVVLFHLGFGWIPGGALGVDVFFVISGYLITRILLNDIHQHTFSLARFYERRARRILPALFPVIVACCVAAYLILDKYTFHLFGSSVAFLSVFGSNFYFSQITQGYFAADAQQAPLLHTWSLSVEEQFYIVYPLLLFYLNRRFAGKIKSILLFLCMASLVAFGIGWRVNANAAFYNSLFRCWQLLAGALLAVEIFPPVKSKMLNGLIAFAGWVMIFSGFVFFHHNSSGAWIFYITTVTGAMCVILSSQHTHNPVLAPLRSGLFIFFGRISYSLYLWHWPIIVFASIVSLEPPDGKARWITACASVLLGFLSYTFIEQPFRNRQGLVKRQRTVLTAAVSMLVIMGVTGICMSHYNGLSNRSRADRMQAECEADPVWMKMGDYQLRFENTKDTMPVFSVGDTTLPVRFILWGDSHARALASGIDSLFTTSGGGNLHGYVFPYPGVAPLLGVEVKRGGEAISQRIFSFIRQHPEISTVILDARWRAYFTRSRDTCKVTDPALLALDSASQTGIPGKQIFKTSLRYTVNELLKLNRQVVILSSTPEVPHNFISLINHARFYNDDLNAFACTVTDFERSDGELNRFIRSLSSQRVKVVAAYGALIKGDHYLIERNGRLLYRDYNHLSRFGAFEVAKAVQRALSDSDDSQNAGLQALMTTNGAPLLKNH